MQKGSSCRNGEKGQGGESRTSELELDPAPPIQAERKWLLEWKKGTNEPKDKILGAKKLAMVRMRKREIDKQSESRQ